jgi:hypothetical protein
LTRRLATFFGNVAKYFGRHSGTLEFTMNSGVMDGYESIRLEEVEELIGKPVWTIVDELDEMLDIILL